MKARVSFVMPAWRPRAQWLLAAVRSVLDEPGCDVELLVVDDGNSEPVENMLSCVEDKHLRVIRIEHGGQCAARNAGISEATGTYVRFVDCDDVVVHGGTAHLLALGEGGDEVISYGATELCNEKLEPVGILACDIQGAAEVDCLFDRVRIQTQPILFPRRVVDAAGPWDTSIDVMADWEWQLRAFEHAPVRGDRQIVYRYRRHGEGIQGHARNQECELVHRRIIAGYFERHPEQLGGAFERRARASPHLKYARTYLRDGHLRLSANRLVRGTLIDPRGGVTTAAALVVRQARRASRFRGRKV
jgi:glycosyltransferase involved in cell wall biosynthesis